MGLKRGKVEFNRVISVDHLSKQSLFWGKQEVTGEKKLQYFTADCKSSKNGQLNPISANPDTLSVSNVAKSWGFNSDFPRWMFLKHYFQNYQQELIGNNHSPKKEGFGDRAVTEKYI